jgi:hypothetical protein
MMRDQLLMMLAIILGSVCVGWLMVLTVAMVMLHR